jgi:hypothetical protein
LTLAVVGEVLSILESPTKTVPSVRQSAAVVVEVELAEAEALEEGEGDDGVERAEEEVDGELWTSIRVSESEGKAGRKRRTWWWKYCVDQNMIPQYTTMKTRPRYPFE